jgi:hypothetical protein
MKLRYTTFLRTSYVLLLVVVWTRRYVVWVVYGGFIIIEQDSRIQYV